MRWRRIRDGGWEPDLPHMPIFPPPPPGRHYFKPLGGRIAGDAPSLKFDIGARIFLYLYFNFFDDIHSMGADVLVNYEAPVVIWSISILCWLSHSEVLIWVGCARVRSYMLVYVSNFDCIVLNKRTVALRSSSITVQFFNTVQSKTLTSMNARMHILSL